MRIKRWTTCVAMVWALAAASATPAKKKPVPAKPVPAPAADSYELTDLPPAAKPAAVEPAPAPARALAQPAPDALPQASVPSPPLEVEAEPSPAAPRSNLFLGVRAGALIPFAFLRPSFEVDAEAEYRLPLLDGRIRLGLSAGFAQTTGKGSRLIQGRGLEPAFIQNVTYFPIELSGRVEIWRTENQAVLTGLGYSAYVTRATFNELGFTTSRTSLGHAAVVLVAYRHRLGPGEIGAAARGTFGAVALGELGKLGSDKLNSFALSASYSFGL